MRDKSKNFCKWSREVLDLKKTNDLSFKIKPKFVELKWEMVNPLTPKIS